MLKIKNFIAELEQEQRRKAILSISNSTFIDEPSPEYLTQQDAPDIVLSDYSTTSGNYYKVMYKRRGSEVWEKVKGYLREISDKDACKHLIFFRHKYPEFLFALLPT